MDWNAVALEIGLLALAVVVLGWDLTFGHGPRGSHRGVHVVAGVGLAGLLAWSFRLPADVVFTDALVQDAFALFVKQVLLVAGLLAVLATHAYADRRGWAERSGEFLVLLLFAMIGGMALVSAQEFLTLFVAFELLSLPLYSLAAIEKNRPESPEGALKIFLFGSVSSAALLLGLGMLFAATGTTFWNEVVAGTDHGSLMDLGMLLLLVALGSNIEPELNLPQAAFKLARRTEILAVSTVYASAPVGAPGTPPFLNAVLRLGSRLGPRTLKFEILRAIETELGRRRSPDRNAPRPIDLDLILFGDRVDSAYDLRLPDPDLTHFPHLAVPAADVAPEVRHPITGQTLAEVAAALSSTLVARPDVVLVESGVATGTDL